MNDVQPEQPEGQAHNVPEDGTSVVADHTPPRDTSSLRQSLQAVSAEIGKVIVGQNSVVTGIMVALLCRGHVLIEGVPGTGKTLLVKALSHALSLSNKRIQFTPDLMPGDITGSLVYDSRTSDFEFRPGPVFANLVLADEINRTPAKTQAALLEAMEERQVTVDGQRHRLPEVFCVAATQNPIEQEGTYRLPEAQLDRFLVKLEMPVPPRDAEFDMLWRHASGFNPRDLTAAGVQPVAGVDDLLAASAAVDGVSASAEVLAYIVDICRATRELPSVELGVSPRGTTALLKTAKAWAWLSGRDFVTPDDVKALAPVTLAHRITLAIDADETATPARLLRTVLDTVPVPR